MQQQHENTNKAQIQEKMFQNIFWNKLNRCSLHCLPSGGERWKTTEPALLLCLPAAAATCCRLMPPSPAATAPSTRSPTPQPAVTPCAPTPPWTASAVTSSRRMPRPAACPTPAWETPGGPAPPAVSCNLMLTHADQKFRNSKAEILRTCR